MDFILDPIIADPEPASKNETKQLNQKTEEEFEKFEETIEKTYNKFQTVINNSSWTNSFQGFFNNDNSNNFFETSKNLVDQGKQIAINKTRQLNEQLNNLHIDNNNNEDVATLTDKTIEEDNKAKKMVDLLTNATNKYLDDLDEELAQVEKFGINYVSKVGDFLKENLVNKEKEKERIKLKKLDELNKGDLSIEESNILFNVPEEEKIPIYSNRTEAQLFALNSSEDLYLTKLQNDLEFEEFDKKFDINEYTEKISEKLKNSSLTKLMNELVPLKISYKDFWTRYFFMYNKILKAEENRKKLIENNNNEEFKWDDDDDEDEDKPIESRTSSELTYDLKSTNSSTLDVVASRKVNGNNSNNNNINNDDDDDDDWE